VLRSLAADFSRLRATIRREARALARPSPAGGFTGAPKVFTSRRARSGYLCVRRCAVGPGDPGRSRKTSFRCPVAFGCRKPPRSTNGRPRARELRRNNVKKSLLGNRPAASRITTILRFQFL